MNPNMDYGQYGRCEATAKSTGDRCGRPAVGEHGKCDIHGGKSPRGMDHPNTMHGLRREYLDDEDRAIYEEVSATSNAEKIQEEIDWIKTKLLRAVRETEGNEGVGMARDLLEKVEDGEADAEVVGALANLLKVSNGAVDRAIGRLNDLAKTHHKITEGDTVNVEHSGQIDGERTIGDDEKAAIRQALDPSS